MDATSTFAPASHSVSNDTNEPPCVDIEMDVEFQSLTPPTPIPVSSSIQSSMQPHFPSPIQSSTPPSIPETPFLLSDIGGSNIENSNYVNVSPPIVLPSSENPVQRRINWRRAIKVLVCCSIIIIMGLFAIFYFGPKRGKVNLHCELNITVSKDGKSNFTTISEAVEASPSYSPYRVCISVATGEYNEMVKIGDEKTNLLLIGEGIGRTIISSNASRDELYTTRPLATLNINGKEFMAQDLSILNTAKHGFAVENRADNSVFFRCRLEGANATLHTNGDKQFYRSCQIYGINNLVFGVARSFFQKCEFRSEKSYPEEKIVFSSQSSYILTFKSSFVFHLCSFYVDKFRNNSEMVFLGSSSGNHASFVIMQSYLDASIGGYLLDTSLSNATYYAVFKNIGGALASYIPPFVRVLNDIEAASKFSLRVFLGGGDWIPGVEYDLDLHK